MFRGMRRFKQLIPDDAVVDIMKRGSTGVLAVLGDEGYPYTVPVNYLYDDGKILIHCSKQGHKIDAINKEPKVSFCVVDRDDVSPGEYTTNYVSAVAFGKAKIVTDPEEVTELVIKFSDKYVPGRTYEEHKQETYKTITSLAIIVIDVEHMTGKERLALANARREGK